MVGGMAQHGARSQKGHVGMPMGVPFSDVAYLESGHRLLSQNHCENDHIVIAIGNV